LGAAACPLSVATASKLMLTRIAFILLFPIMPISGRGRALSTGSPCPGLTRGFRPMNPAFRRRSLNASSVPVFE
jgi:hypothetical protein